MLVRGTTVTVRHDMTGTEFCRASTVTTTNMQKHHRTEHDAPGRPRQSPQSAQVVSESSNLSCDRHPPLHIECDRQQVVPIKIIANLSS